VCACVCVCVCVCVYLLVSCGVVSAMIRELRSLDPEIRDRSGQSPLHVAATMPHSSALRSMLDVFYAGPGGTTGAGRGRAYDVDHATTAGDSALHVCCVDGDAGKVRMMLRRGADLERLGSSSLTILHRLVQVRSTRRLTAALRWPAAFLSKSVEYRSGVRSSARPSVCLSVCLYVPVHVHTHPFNGPLSRTRLPG